MRTTKIVATVGPATASSDLLDRILDVGVDIVRFNMSHGTHSDHEGILANLEKLVSKKSTHVGLMADLCGPKVRTGSIDSTLAEIERGAHCDIVRKTLEGTAQRFDTNYPNLVDDVAVGHRVLIDDGAIRLRATAKTRDTLTCVCETGGFIGSRKGINLPDSDLALDAMTEKDHIDLKWVIKNEFDFIALSFVRCPEDVVRLREAMRNEDADIPIVAKIETPQAIDAIDAIIEVSDALLVARGDLGVEMEVSHLPVLQKEIVRKCRDTGKPVIVATQMLHSMVTQPSPTRAEVSDVANAVFDGADAVMLSAESASGRYPVESVAMMNRICRDAYEYQVGDGDRRAGTTDGRLRVGQETDRTISAVVRSATLVTQDLRARLLAVWCRSGRTAQWMSKYRLPTPLVGMSSRPSICRRLALSYGVQPMLVPSALADGSAPWHELESRLVSDYGLARGDLIVVVGDPAAPDRASTLSIHSVGS